MPMIDFTPEELKVTRDAIMHHTSQCRAYVDYCNRTTTRTKGNRPISLEEKVAAENIYQTYLAALDKIETTIAMG